MSNKNRIILLVFLSISFSFFYLLSVEYSMWFYLGIVVFFIAAILEATKMRVKQKPIKEQWEDQMLIIQAAYSKIKEIQENCPHTNTFEWFNSNPSTVCSDCNKNLYE